VTALRRGACQGLAGRVLELGAGSGRNLALLPARVTALHVVEPSDLAWEMSAGRRARATVPVKRIGLDGQRLPVGDASYDAVLSTFTLCTIPDPAQALAEVRRVLRPGGSVHFLEHGLADDPTVARWQRRLDPVHKRVAGGCHLSRDVPRLVEAAGLELAELRVSDLPGPAAARPWLHGFVGRAAASAD
uniref:class I SAM-dependent methyltransferase n=1 Tax=Nocardioides sp. SYSU DS0663 TaxID=3416445 RepID=UPI003F4C9FF3